MEGYLVLALHDPRYLDLAANFALSVRRLETRPVSVVTSPEIEVPEPYLSLFDQIIRLEDHPSLKGAMAKTLLFGATPYDQTMYIDSDCLLFNTRIEVYWRKFRGQAFAVEGFQQRRGPVFACSLGVKQAEDLCALVNVERLTVFNAGVMYFEKSDASKKVFETAVELFEGPHRDAISYPYKHAGEYADEPYFACALAMNEIPPHQATGVERWQVTTPNMIEAVMDLTLGDLRIAKYREGQDPLVWTGPICHFCGLAPMDTYFYLTDQLRDEAQLPRMDRSLFQAKVMQPTDHQDSAESE
jgi:hypothetical protein